MTVMGWLQILLILAAVVAAAIPLGAYIARVMTGERTFMTAILSPVERGFYALAGVDPRREQGWRAYTLAMLTRQLRKTSRPISARSSPAAG